MLSRSHSHTQAFIAFFGGHLSLRGDFSWVGWRAGGVSVVMAALSV